MNPINFAEVIKTVEGLVPAADAGGRTGDYVSLKNADGVWIVVHMDQGNAATVLLSPFQAQDVGATGEKPIAVTPIWADQDCAASDALVKQTDADTFTTSAAVKHKVVLFYIPAEKLDVANGFDAVCVKTGASNAANITQAMMYLTGVRHQQAAIDSAIID